jgi:hypothetical protein
MPGVVVVYAREDQAGAEAVSAAVQEFDPIRYCLNESEATMAFGRQLPRIFLWSASAAQFRGTLGTLIEQSPAASVVVRLDATDGLDNKRAISLGPSSMEQISGSLLSAVRLAAKSGAALRTASAQKRSPISKLVPYIGGGVVALLIGLTAMAAMNLSPPERSQQAVGSQPAPAAAAPEAENVDAAGEATAPGDANASAPTAPAAEPAQQPAAPVADSASAPVPATPAVAPDAGADEQATPPPSEPAPVEAQESPPPAAAEPAPPAEEAPAETPAE